MTELEIIAVLTVGGNILVSTLGIYANKRMINYRIEQLEKKVDKHNGIYDDVADVKVNMATITGKLETICSRLENLENKKARKTE